MHTPHFEHRDLVKYNVSQIFTTASVDQLEFYRKYFVIVAQK